MTSFYLPKGTIVKHGTSLPRAEKIISEGFSSGFRNEVRVANELMPEQQGTYVGELIAYFGAYAAYSSELVSMWRELGGERVLFYFYQSPEKLRTLDLTNVPVTLPVILNIELMEDCEVLADEDFVYDGNYPINSRVPHELLINEASYVWDNWKSGLIKKNIPSDWVKEIEYPSLGKFGKINPSKDTWHDCELFLGGLMQSYSKMRPTDFINQYIENRGRLSLSNCKKATPEAIKKIMKSVNFNSKADQLCNYLAISQIMEQMTASQNIELYR